MEESKHQVFSDVLCSFASFRKCLERDWGGLEPRDVICSIMNLLACTGYKTYRAKVLQGLGCLPIHYSCLSGMVSQFVSASTWHFGPRGGHFEPCEAPKAAGRALTGLPSPSSSHCSVAVKRQQLPEPSHSQDSAHMVPLLGLWWAGEIKTLKKKGYPHLPCVGGKKLGSPGSLVLPDSA